jgi:hypothetical protein
MVKIPKVLKFGLSKKMDDAGSKGTVGGLPKVTYSVGFHLDTYPIRQIIHLCSHKYLGLVV